MWCSCVNVGSLFTHLDLNKWPTHLPRIAILHHDERPENSSNIQLPLYFEKQWIVGCNSFQRWTLGWTNFFCLKGPSVFVAFISHVTPRLWLLLHSVEVCCYMSSCHCWPAGSISSGNQMPICSRAQHQFWAGLMLYVITPLLPLHQVFRGLTPYVIMSLLVSIHSEGLMPYVIMPLLASISCTEVWCYMLSC